MKLSSKILLSTIAVWFLLVFGSGFYFGNWLGNYVEMEQSFNSD